LTTKLNEIIFMDVQESGRNVNEEAGSKAWEIA
jgi:hypothetical protein